VAAGEEQEDDPDRQPGKDLGDRPFLRKTGIAPRTVAPIKF
jgi:hypothetical protein